MMVDVNNLTEGQRKRLREIQECANLSGRVMYGYVSESNTARDFLDGIASCRRMSDIPEGTPTWWSFREGIVHGPFSGKY